MNFYDHNHIQVVVGVLKNSSNEVLLSTRTHKTDFPDHLEFPGGKKESDETPKMTLKRELKEETGIISNIAERGWRVVGYR